MFCSETFHHLSRRRLHWKPVLFIAVLVVFIKFCYELIVKPRRIPFLNDSVSPAVDSFNPVTIYQLIDRYEVISFDIFDTLLLRPYVKPTDLFYHLELLEKVPGYAYARIRAEQDARKKIPEATLDEIYSELCGYPGMKEKEKQLEEQVLTANSEMKPVFDYAKMKGRRIVIVSDNYLPEQFLKSVLETNGYTGFTNLYVSCEYRKNKHSGALFQEVIEHERVNPQSILHIGDNTHSDQKMAYKNKISSVRYTKVIDQLLHNDSRSKLFLERHPGEVNASILLGMIAMKRSLNNTYWHRIGYTYAGPSILGYMKWLDNNLIDNPPTDVLFVARDGYTLQKVFDIIKTKDHPSFYIYAPRKVAIVINFDYECYRCAEIILEQLKPKSTFLQMNLPAKLSRKAAIRFIKQHINLIAPMVEEARKDFAEYLHSLGITSDTVAFVDTISNLLTSHRSVSVALPNRNITGYYWLTLREINQSEYRTVTFQQGYQILIRQWNLMEFLITAPTPPIAKLEHGVVTYITPSVDEAIRYALYPDVSEGAVAFARDYVRLFNKTEISFTSDMITDWVNIFCDNPTPVDKAEFSIVKHAADPTHSKYQHVMADWYDHTTVIVITVVVAVVAILLVVGGILLFSYSHRHRHSYCATQTAEDTQAPATNEKLSLPAHPTI